MVYVFCIGNVSRHGNLPLASHKHICYLARALSFSWLSCMFIHGVRNISGTMPTQGVTTPRTPSVPLVAGGGAFGTEPTHPSPSCGHAPATGGGGAERLQTESPPGRVGAQPRTLIWVSARSRRGTLPPLPYPPEPETRALLLYTLFTITATHSPERAEHSRNRNGTPGRSLESLSEIYSTVTDIIYHLMYS